MRCFRVCLLLCLFGYGSLCGLTLEPVAAPDAPDGAPVISPGGGWVTLWEEAGTGIGASMRVRIDAVGLHVAVRVEDPAHSNEYEKKFLWRGDCLYVAFDGLGDSSDCPVASDGDDGVVLLGLGRNGAEAAVSAHGDAAKTGPLPGDQYRIWRDEAEPVTHYECVLPWDLLGSAPGISNCMGLAAVVAHKNTDGEDLVWGRVFTRNADQRSLNLVGISDPGPVAAVAPGEVRLLLPDAVSLTRFAVDTGDKAMLEVEVRDASGSMLLQQLLESGGSGRVVGGLAVSMQDIKRHGSSLNLRFRTGAGEWVDTPLSFTTLESRVGRLIESVEAALERPGVEPVEAIHLESLRGLAARVLADSRFHRDPDWHNRAIATIEAFLTQFPAEGFSFRTHLANGLPLVFAFIADHDGSLQFSTLQLPPDWQPGTDYPLVVYLHGSGPRTPLDTLATAITTSGQDTLWREGTGVRIDEGQRQCVLLAPYGRGSQGYVGAAEQDVWQAMELLEKAVRIDPDCRYITGFSMGCSGAWYLAHRRPDLWAGINVAAGFGSFSFTQNSAFQQGRGLPVAVWCGELDSFYPGARKFVESLGAAPDLLVRYVPDLTHTYPYAEFGRMMSWLFQHKRGARPRKFTYASNSVHYGGRDGVWTFRPSGYADDLAGRLDVSIDGAVIRVDSLNATGLRVEPGLYGFGEGDTLEIVWNGERVFSGEWRPAAPLQFGEKATDHPRHIQFGSGLR